MEIVGLFLYLIVISLYAIKGVIIAAIVGLKEEGTLQERYNNPDLNTNNLDIHNSRLNGFRRSKFKGVMYYLGPRGGYYYYSRNGNKVYC